MYRKLQLNCNFSSTLNLTFLKLQLFSFFNKILNDIEQINNKKIAIIATPIPDFKVKNLEVAIGFQKSCNKIAIVATGIATHVIIKLYTSTNTTLWNYHNKIMYYTANTKYYFYYIKIIILQYIN